MCLHFFISLLFWYFSCYHCLLEDIACQELLSNSRWNKVYVCMHACTQCCIQHFKTWGPSESDFWGSNQLLKIHVFIWTFTRAREHNTFNFKCLLISSVMFSKSSLMTSERKRRTLLCPAGEPPSQETLLLCHRFQKTHNASQSRKSARMLRIHS